MYKDMVSVMDFGSSKVTVLVGQREVNKSIRLLASAESEYEGYSGGEFIGVSSLKTAMSQSIDDVERQLGCDIRDIFVGVPAEFCFAYDKLLTKTFSKKTKITPKLVDSLFLDDDESNPYLTHTVINKSSLFYIVNDENKTNQPLGMYANKLQTRAGYILVENKFKLIVGGILEGLDIKNYDFISNTLSESVHLLPEQKRNEGAIIVDCGYISTSVAQALGDGLKELKSFSMGGGFITSDLSKAFEIPFDEAEELKHQAIVTLSPLGVEYYQTASGRKFSIKAVNEIILNRVDKILVMVGKCIDTFAMELPKYIPIYLTGGGLNYIEGIKDYFRRVLDRPVEFVTPKLLLYAKPDLSSSISLLDMALNLYK
ncbi:MAG: hypothetical protein E7354_00405 [Clostridiales bacterium]|nr:hypothetical protein [Clostridiales bacterium]